MEQELTVIPNEHDVKYSWVLTSRFMFYLYVIIFAVFAFAVCYGLYVKRYKGKPDVEIPSSTLYNPVYK